MKRIRRDLDETDRALCALLVLDPRASNRSLGKAVGLTDETVASRLRRLREINVLGTTAAVDWHAAGYKAAAMIRVRLGRRSASEVAEEIPRDDIQFLGATVGCCDMYIGMIAADHQALRAKVIQVVRSTDGIDSITTDILTEVSRYDLHSMTLPVQPWSPREFPAPEPPLDDLDISLIEMLATDGHESNRELARRLDVSDGTVRSRIRRLEDAGLVRVIAGTDPIVTGDLRLAALVFVTLDEDGEAIDKLVGHELVLTAYRGIGAADLVLHVGARNNQQIDSFVTDEVRGVRGVRGVEVAFITEVLEHKTYLGRFLDR